MLALLDALIAFASLYAGVLIRFQTPLGRIHALEQELGPLWPRGMVFAAIVVAVLLALGVYSRRLPLTHTVLRFFPALIITSALAAALFYVLPSLSLYRGAWVLAVVLAYSGLLALRVIVRLVDRA